MYVADNPIVSLPVAPIPMLDAAGGTGIALQTPPTSLASRSILPSTRDQARPSHRSLSVSSRTARRTSSSRGTE